MQTVPTLCATSSIIGAGGIGFTFGQTADPQIPSTPSSASDFYFRNRPSHKRHGSGFLRNFASSPMPSLASSRPSRPATPLPSWSRKAPASSTEDPDKISPLADLDPQEHENSSSIHRLSFVPRPEPVDTTLINHTNKTSSTLRRRPSRLKQRLSSWSISLSSSPSYYDRPESRSLATSAGSEEPFFPHCSDGARLPPNKLVKRSLSQHLPNRPGTEPVIRTHTLDRPATRHKRLATLTSDSWMSNAPFVSSSGHHVPSDLLPSYFNSSVPREFDSSIATKRIGPNDKRSIRRILPRPAPSPGLCLPKTVVPATVGIDTSLERDDEPVPVGTRPSSSSAFLHFFSSPGPELDGERDNSVHVTRRSTSFGDLFSRTATLKNSTQVLKVQLGDRRVVSAPTATMLDNEHSDDIPGHRRQNVDSSDSTTESPLRDRIEREPSGTIVARSEEENYTPSGHSSSLRTPPSNVSLNSGSRRSRHSAAFSDLTSSHPGSEFDGKVFSSGDEDEMRSDTAYDSVRTGVTKSSGGYNGPALETLFDKESPLGAHDELESSFQYFGRGSSTSPITNKGYAIVEEDSSTSTPGRTIIPDRRGSSEQDATGPASSPQAPGKALNLGRLSWHADADKASIEWPVSIEDDKDWSHDDDTFASASRKQTQIQNPDPLDSVRRKLDFLEGRRSTEDSDTKSNLFDWSESASVDRGRSDSPPPRPKTVHGKKNPDATGSRVGTRRAPSGLHARSQSVPVLADLVNPRSTVTSKFGTWGIGSKGVTEDWNDDFDFEEPAANDMPTQAIGNARDRESGPAMVVPETIKAQQTNVLANIGLLKEWGLLIEELKELKNRASVLGVDTDRHADVFDEVDAMIDLADQEVEHEPLPRRTPTSSPGFEFDEPGRSASPTLASSLDTRSAEADAEIDSTMQTPNRSSFASYTPSHSEMASVNTRPRKNSEAVAQSVIEALQHRRRVTYLATPEQPTAKKIPFDTRTLRKIVPHVSGLVKRVKQILREVEGLHSSPKAVRATPDPAFRRAFFRAPDAEEHTGEDLDGGEGLVEELSRATIREESPSYHLDRV